MNNKELIETTRDIVVAMIETKLLSAESKSTLNSSITDTIETIYLKLAELNSKNVKLGFEQLSEE